MAFGARNYINTKYILRINFDSSKTPTMRSTSPAQKYAIRYKIRDVNQQSVNICNRDTGRKYITRGTGEINGGSARKLMI